MRTEDESRGRRPFARAASWPPNPPLLPLLLSHPGPLLPLLLSLSYPGPLLPLLLSLSYPAPLSPWFSHPCSSLSLTPLLSYPGPLLPRSSLTPAPLSLTPVLSYPCSSLSYPGPLTPAPLSPLLLSHPGPLLPLLLSSQVLLHVLFEHASGYALLVVKEVEEISLLLPQVEVSVLSLAKFNGMVSLAAFFPFKSAQGALENMNAISEGTAAPHLASLSRCSNICR